LKEEEEVEINVIEIWSIERIWNWRGWYV